MSERTKVVLVKDLIGKNGNGRIFSIAYLKDDDIWSKGHGILGSGLPKIELATPVTSKTLDLTQICMMTDSYGVAEANDISLQTLLKAVEVARGTTYNIVLKKTLLAIFDQYQCEAVVYEAEKI